MTFSQRDAAAFDLLFPVRGRELCVQRLEKLAGYSADIRAVGHEAVSDAAVERPLIAQRSVEQDAVIPAPPVPDGCREEVHDEKRGRLVRRLRLSMVHLH